MYIWHLWHNWARMSWYFLFYQLLPAVDSASPVCMNWWTNYHLDLIYFQGRNLVHDQKPLTSPNFKLMHQQKMVPRKTTILKLLSTKWVIQFCLKCLNEPKVSCLLCLASIAKQSVNHLRAILFYREQEPIFTFHVIPPHWHDTGCWHPSSSNTRTYLFYLVNIMDADVLATQGAKASTSMIFTMLHQINSVPTR